MSTFSFFTQAPRQLQTDQYRPVGWLIVVLLVVVLFIGVYRSRHTYPHKRHVGYSNNIDLEDGGILDIVEHFSEIPSRPYPLQQNYHFKLQVKRYVPFIIQIPGVQGECDFQGVTTTVQDADIIVARKSEALDRIKAPGKCTNREYFQIVATKSGVLTRGLTILYSHRNGQSIYSFDLYVS